MKTIIKFKNMTDKTNIKIIPTQEKGLLQELVSVNPSAYEELSRYGTFLIKALKDNPNAKVKEMQIKYQYFKSDKIYDSVRIEEIEESTGFVKETLIKNYNI